MENDAKMNISVVIPTWNREELLDKLLETLFTARSNYKYGETEVVVVDSSKDEAKAKIMQSCEKYDAVYYEGTDSVRQKRNKGIDMAKYEVIHFIDSDVTVDKDILNRHAETFLNDKNEKLAGSFGYTEFVGDKNFWWHVVENTTYLDSFHFSRMFPYQSWTIGNNVAFYKDVLLKCGKFREDFPYKLGGDDLEFTYRITKNGYLIKSAPDAVCYHSTDTWRHHAAIQNRTKRWGSMEYFIKTIHPELFVNCIIKSDIRFIFFLVLFVIISLAAMNPTPVISWVIWVLIYFIANGVTEMKKKGTSNFFYYTIGKIFREKYHIYYMLESMKHKDFSFINKEMSFSLGQTMFMYREASKKLWMWLASGAAAVAGTLIIFEKLL